MKVKAIKTKKVVVGDKLFDILDNSLPHLNEKDVLVITSKIVSITQGNVIKNDGRIDKLDLIKKEADLLMPERYLRFGVHLTIKNNLMIGSAGIDESNGNGYFILWPKNLRETTNNIWKYLRNKHKIKYLGIIVSDSHSSPFRRGAVGFGISWCGFEPLISYVNKPDIFGRLLKYEHMNVVDNIAGAATLEMGEGNEQTPIAIANQINHIKFVNRTPNEKEIEETTITLDTDIYSGMFNKTEWKKDKKQ